MEDYMGHTVINISDIDLTTAQVSILSKGLTFCPTPWENLEKLFRKMHQKSHFDTNGDDLDDDLAYNLEVPTGLHVPIWKSFKPTSTYNQLAQEDTLET